MPDFKPIAVIDANVLISTCTCLHPARHSDCPGWSVDTPTARADRVKARQAVILSWHLHESRAATYCLWEPLRIIMDRVNIDGDPIRHFTVIWSHYIHKRLIPGWTIVDPLLGAMPGSVDEETLREEMERVWSGEPTSNAADQLHVDKAKGYGVPLITFEGLRNDGSIDPKSGIRLRAARAGVTVMTPAEFYAGRDELLTCALFLNAYRDRADAWIQQISDSEPIARAVRRFEDYYRHVLFGVVEGRSDPVPVTF